MYQSCLSGRRSGSNCGLADRKEGGCEKLLNAEYLIGFIFGSLAMVLAWVISTSISENNYRRGFMDAIMQIAYEIKAEENEQEEDND